VALYGVLAAPDEVVALVLAIEGEQLAGFLSRSALRTS